VEEEEEGDLAETEEGDVAIVKKKNHQLLIPCKGDERKREKRKGA